MSINSFTVFEDETFSSFDGSAVFQLDGSYPFHTDAIFLNLGTIESTDDTFAVAIGCWNAGGLFDNRGTVRSVVTGEGGTAYGLTGPAWIPDIVNWGVWHVESGGVAFGLVTSSPEGVFTNHGDWTVNAYSDAWGARFNNQFSIVNDGNIIVTSQTGRATAIVIDLNAGTITNDGLISAEGGDSVALLISGWQGPTGAPNIVNSGVISGQFAIYTEPDGQLFPRIDLLNTETGVVNGVIFLLNMGDTIDNRGIINGPIASAPFLQGLPGSISVTNSGDIYGSILLDLCPNVSISNTGYIEGDVFLGSSNSVYNGEFGMLVGAVYGGGGDVGRHRIPAVAGQRAKHGRRRAGHAH